MIICFSKTNFLHIYIYIYIYIYNIYIYISFESIKLLIEKGNLNCCCHCLCYCDAVDGSSDGYGRANEIFSIVVVVPAIRCLFSVMFLLMINQCLPTLLMHVHLIVFSYAPFKPSEVAMNVIIFPLTRSLHNLTSLSFLQPLL